MSFIKIPKEELARFELDQERDELLSVLADDDLYLRDRKFLRQLVRNRLLEIEREYGRRGLKISDAAEFAENKDYVDRLNRGKGESDEGEVSH